MKSSAVVGCFLLNRVGFTAFYNKVLVELWKLKE